MGLLLPKKQDAKMNNQKDLKGWGGSLIGT